MQQRALGPFQVSAIGLGCMNLSHAYGAPVSAEQGERVLLAALDAGVTLFDTAALYGFGANETLVGRVMKPHRHRFTLASKCGMQGVDVNGDGKLVRVIDGRPATLRQTCEDSLRRLQTDHIDLYQMHHIDRDCPWEEVWQAMEQLCREGKVLYIGSSNFAGWHIAQAQELAKSRHFLGLISEQSLYNLLERTVELEVIPACQAYGIGIIPWSPLARGLLGGALETHTSGRRAEEDVQKEIATHRPKLEAYEQFCRRHQLAPAAVALAWLLHQPAVTSPIIGPRTMEQLTTATQSLELRLTPEHLTALDAIFPGPGGAAPEAYAW